MMLLPSITLSLALLTCSGMMTATAAGELVEFRSASDRVMCSGMGGYPRQILPLKFNFRNR
jgi:hypothetical protein